MRDVIVIGAGLPGAVAALAIGGAGRRVLLIEQAIAADPQGRAESP